MKYIPIARNTSTAVLIGPAAPLPSLQAALHAADNKPGKPNIIVMPADDIGYGDLGCHDNRQVRTLHLDSFAHAAVEFTRSHVSPVCSPARASLMTGRDNFRTGVCDVFGKAAMMGPSAVTIAERMKQQYEQWFTEVCARWNP
jgi:hypothetical protein